ncbi:MAG: hypothetical protein A2144_05550 [Chloroflexi bacterium RBG_16_50_9]|nr:MAG: hypothetical protein A2144_05550 [Chloroflexi bacterium RBG_16_50_9]
MTLTHVALLLITGAGAGFAAGLLGLGGAFIMTPVQYIIFTDAGLPSDVAVRLAFGTSLMVVLPTAISGAWRHHHKGVVWWRAAFIMGICGLIFAFVGATLSVYLPGAILKAAFGVIVILSAARMVIGRQPRIAPEPVTNHWILLAWAIPIGLISGIFGIGGAVLMIPVMVVALRFEMHKAVATSMAVIIFTAIGGTTGYIINGLGVPDLPPYSIGYVNLPSWVLLSVTSIGMAQVGAIAAHKLSANLLKYFFAVVMLYMGLRMIGVFDWLGWPI